MINNVEDKKIYENYVSHICSPKVYYASRIKSSLIRAFVNYFDQKGVRQLMPLMLSPETDPLNHSVCSDKIKYYNNNLMLMKSMILHKQIILSNANIDSIYIISPNVRLEKKESSIKGRHLIEFTQIDFEFKNKDKEYVMSFMEDMYIYIFNQIKNECKEELDFFDRELHIPTKPFKRYDSKQLLEEYGDNYEDVISRESEQLFWIENHDRWFYDKENPYKNGCFLNFDVVYPEGFGEGASGAERETDYNKLILRMKKTNCNPDHYTKYLSLAKNNLIPMTAGAGIGFERLLRYICGTKNIDEICLFAKNAGERIIL